MQKVIVGVGAVLLLAGGGCAGSEGADSWGLSALNYTLPEDGSITITSESVRPEKPNESLILADTLYVQALECGNARDPQYYADLENLFVGKFQQKYTFAIAGDYEMPTWTVTLMSNSPAYTSLESFKKDFDICAVGGYLYPKAMSTSTLMFTDSCGSGYSGGKENGCDAIRQAVESTLSIE